MDNYCLFCSQGNIEIIDEDEFCYTINDSYPVQDGHTLIITKRHISSFFECTESEIKSIFSLIGIAKLRLNQLMKPDGYNIGINIGKYAGQTINHVHIHLIPRYKNDVADPKGGIRNLMPNKVAYPE